MFPKEDKRQAVHQDRVISFLHIMSVFHELLSKPREVIIDDFESINQSKLYNIGIIIPVNSLPRLISWHQEGFKSRFGILVSDQADIIIYPDVLLTNDKIHPDNSNWIVLDSTTVLQECS
jgi:hypothetical protein